MKKILLILIVCSTLQIAYTQSGWEWQNPLPQGNNLNTVQFLNINTGYVIGDAGTVMKTTNGGLSWNSKYYVGGISSDNLAPKDLGAICFINPLTGFIGTSTFSVSSNPAVHKIMKTTNGGELWNNVTDSNYFSFKTIFFIDALTGWSSCSPQQLGGMTNASNVLLKTTNGGSNWFIQNSNLYPISSSFFINSNTGWLVGYYDIPYPASARAYYIYKTTDGGTNWITQMISNQQQSLKTVFFINGNTGWAGGTQFWKTTNSGDSWNYIVNPINSISFVNTMDGFYINNYGLNKTTDSGNNWITVCNIGGNFFSAADINNVFVVGNYGAIFKTINSGNTWSRLDSSLVPWSESLNPVLFVDNMTGYIIGSSGKILKTSNGGFNWLVIYNFSLPYLLHSMYFQNVNTGWVVGDGLIFKTNDGGLNWTTQFNNSSYHIYSISFIDQFTGWAVTNGNTDLYTTNGGLNWSIRNGIVVGYSYIYSHFFNAYTGVKMGSLGIARTTDAGNTWQTISNMNCYYGCVDNLNNIYTGTWNMITMSTDFGANWSVITSSETPSFYCLHMLNSLTGYGCGLHGYVAKTTNGGVNWYRQISNTGWDIKSIYFTDENTGWLVGDAGTILSTVDGGGNIVRVNPIDFEIPNSFSLSQNYPNPFNPVTKIKFDIPANVKRQTSNVKLIIYDILGREVTTLVNEALKPGSYEAEWPAPSGDGSNFASGIYFYSLQTEEFNQTKKMVLMK